MPSDLATLCRIAEARGVPLIEDAACAAGSEILWQGAWEKIGRPRGVAACFSFHPRKIMTTGEGGMITSGDAAFAARLRRLRAHGMDLDAHARHVGGVMTERFDEPGFNMRMTDVQAAIGRVQLAGLDDEVRRRRVLAARYAERLKTIPGLGVPREPASARSNWQSYCVGLPDGVDQQTVMRRLAEDGVASRRGVMCAHREPAYPSGSWSCRPDADCACGESGCERLRFGETAQDRSLLIPMFGAMTASEQDRVVAALAAACGR
jgi:dTDP-4-amino-4,6-dideoxygalactose transaminase